jgi:glycosyltransferase involved in cell wall biosynthesis
MKNPFVNVLYDNHIFVTQTYGGVSRIFYELIKNLAEKEEVNIFLFLGFFVNHFPLEDLKKKMAFYFGKRIRPLPYTKKFLRVFNTVLFDLFKPHKEIDIFHPTDYSPVVPRWKKSPLVVTVYDMIYELYPHFFKNLDIKNRIERKKRCIERADGIIAISNSTKNDLLTFYNVDEKKVRVIYPGAPSHIQLNENKNLFANKKPYILYVGTRKRSYKNFKNLLMAFASNKKINKEFDLMCFGGGVLTPGEIELISQAGSQDHVFQMSGDDDILRQLYMNARAFVYPSLYEGFGLPPLEAMVYGCPVIASHVSALPEVLGEAAVYFDPHDPASISTALEKVLLSNSKIQEMVRKGFIQAQQYSWSKMAGETYRVYKDAAGTVEHPGIE